MPQEEWEMGNAGKETGENYLTEDLTQQALNYIDERSKDKDQPFFLYFSHFVVHTPYQGIQEDVEYFQQKETKGWNGHKDPVYAAMVKSLDRSVGAILKKLKETGIEENTLVIFMSDNGGIDAQLTPEDYGTANAPFLGGKATVNEGGIRVPLIFRWKGKVKEGQWVDVPVDGTDIYPSILAASGYDSEKILTDNELDGQSILPLLKDVENKEGKYSKTTHIWHYPFNVIYKSPYDGFALTPHTAIRKEDYKLIFDWHGRLNLYDIQKEPFEKNELSREMPDKTNELFREMMSWMEDNVEKRYWPRLNPEYNPEKESRDTHFKDIYKSYKENEKQLVLSAEK